ncbi:N-acetyltransferase 8 [Dugong dugon]
MARYHIRKYQESNHKLFSEGLTEYVPIAFHMLRLPQTLMLLLGGALTLFLVSGSWLLALIASLSLLAALRFLAKYPWTQCGVRAFNTDLSDITKTYLSVLVSCFWVAESEEQVVGMVGCLPAEDPTLQRKQLELFHLCVTFKHCGQGMAKALVRTVLQFAWDQGYSEVVLAATVLQDSALGLYQSLGFQKIHKFFFSMSFRIITVPAICLIYHPPSAQVCQALQKGGGL